VAIEVRDITVIGGGPTGLFGAFYAGMRGASARIIDSLPQLGGQLSALYPEKYIYDVAGFPKVLAKDLVRGLVEQGLQFGAQVLLNQEVTGLRREVVDGEEVFVLDTPSGPHGTRTILVAAGIGPFAPRRLGLADEERWLGRGLYDRVVDPEAFRDRRVLIVGGGDSAFDWAAGLAGLARSVLQIHRSAGFKAHAATVRTVEALCAEGRMELRTFRVVRALHGDERVREAVLVDTRSKAEERVEVDAVIALLGFVSRLGAVADWGLTVVKDDVVVSSAMETGRPGLYAAGDVVTYAGKLKLIATAVAEAAVAVNGAVRFIRPDAKFEPGHSSSMDRLFGKVGWLAEAWIPGWPNGARALSARHGLRHER
jgi:thioredoxin reductase